jgi:hypothetical protein
MFTKLRNLFASLFREPNIEILPPLAAGRTKPFPQRPHHKRRQLVRQVLDAAPSSLTDRQLIELIREQTGVGCSFRTICEWRKERRSEQEKEQQRKQLSTQTIAASLRPAVIALLFCVVSLAASSCRPPQTVAAQSISNFQSPISNPPSDGIVITQPSETNENKETPRLLQLKLTINAASDLLVKTDDEVKAGQVLTNRSHERNRLLAQRRVLETQAQQIEAQLTTAAESLVLLEQRGAELPPISFASEQAAITKAEAEAAVTARRVELQKQRLAVLPAVVPNGYDKQAVEAHETAKLTQAQDTERQANAEIALQKAKLTSAQEARAFQEKQHALEVAKQLLTARQQQQQAVIARSQLLTQIAALDLQLAQLAEVRAPFAGKIRRIEYEDMHDQTLTVLVYLSVH